MRLAKRLVLLVALCVLTGPALRAQQAPVLTATLTPLVETSAIRAGTSVKLAMRVVLAPDLHVQSNVPSDPGFIATVLTVEPPAGITVDELVYPAATDLKQAGVDEPLSVYGHDFVGAVRIRVAHTPAPVTVVTRGRDR